MALMSELVEATAETVGYPLSTVQTFARVLREADLLSKHGRGPAAAHATASDGARLLLALLATPISFAGGKIPDAAEAVADFGALVQGDNTEKYATGDNPITLGAAYGLPRKHTLEEALTAIIAGFAQKKKFPPIEVAVNNTLQARIFLGDPRQGSVQQYHYGFRALVDRLPHGNPRRPVREHSNLKEAAAEWERAKAKYTRGIDTEQKIGLEVLQKIAAVINGEESE